MLCMTSQDLQQSIKEIIRDCEQGQEGLATGFQDMNLGEIQELMETPPEELTEDDLVEMNASKQEPDEEKENLEETVQKTN